MSTASASTTNTTVPFLRDALPSPAPELRKAGGDSAPLGGLRSRSREELDLEKVESAGDEGDEEEEEDEEGTGAALLGSAVTDMFSPSGWEVLRNMSGPAW